MTANGSMAQKAARDTAEDARDFRDDFAKTVDYARQALPDLADRARGFIADNADRYRDQFKDQGKEYADLAGEQLENARVFVVDRVQERPLTATLAALGVGFLIGILLSAGGRK